MSCGGIKSRFPEGKGASEMSEILWPQPFADQLTSYLDRALGKGAYGHIIPADCGCTLLEHLPKISKKGSVKVFRQFGSQQIPAAFTTERSIGTTSHLLIHDFVFEEHRLIAFSWSYPREGVFPIFFFPKGQLSLVDRVILELRKFQKRSKQVYLYSRSWIPIDKLDTSRFVVPSMVQKLFELEIAPQLETRTIHNHALLYSPPGYGKTAYIRYLSKKYLDWTFIIVDPSSVEKPFQIFDAYNNAAAYEPAIVFFEDIDTLGRHRGQISEYNPFLGALLSAIDGLETHMGVYTIASTNNPLAVDPGLRRAGRLGLHIPFRYTREEMVGILNRYLDSSFSIKEAAFIATYGPSQVRSIAKSALGKARLKKISLTLDLIKETARSLPKEPILVTDFTPLPHSSMDKAAEPCPEKAV